MDAVQHKLRTSRLGDVQVFVPKKWPTNYGFIVQVGPQVRRPLIRIQSRCSYGEVFGSFHCDCGNQLEQSFDLIKKSGGYIFYLDQEGRSAGIKIKAEAYMAQENTGIDTFRFYELQHISCDPRNYGPVVEAILELSITEVSLLTNNPLKVKALQSGGIVVKQIPLVVEADAAAADYLEAKRMRGHTL